MKFGEVYKRLLFYVTRMHSSRMRTTSTLTVSPSTICLGGGVWWGGLLRGVGSAPGGRGCAWSQGGCIWSGTPPVDRMTHASENITLPKTSFAGGKKLYVDFSHLDLELS